MAVLLVLKIATRNNYQPSVPVNKNKQTGIRCFNINMFCQVKYLDVEDVAG